MDSMLAYAICTCSRFLLYFVDMEVEALQTATRSDLVWPGIIEMM